MSRKARKRKKRKDRTLNLPQQVLSGASRKSKRTGVGLHTKSDFNPDYGYVVKDLKRIGILAGSFIVILIILSIVLT